MSMIFVVAKLTKVSAFLLLSHTNLTPQISGLANSVFIKNQMETMVNSLPNASDDNIKSSRAFIDQLQVDIEEKERLLRRGNLEGINQLIADIKSSATSFEKDWHGFHYLLNQTDWEVTSVVGSAVLGGKELGADIGYGPLRYLSESEVKAIAAEMAKLSHEDLVARYNSVEMNKLSIYPGGWDLEENRQDLLDQFEIFRNFYYKAAASGESVVILVI